MLKKKDYHKKMETITQQDHQTIRKANKEIVSFFALVSEAIKNGLNKPIM